MPTKRQLEREAQQKSEAIIVGGNDIADVFEALDSEPVVDMGSAADFLDDDDGVEAESEEMVVFSSGFQSLQMELEQIRQARAKLSADMEKLDLDKDERDTLKARSALLDSRERSAREELKLFHKNELGNLGQIRKIRIVIEDYLANEPVKTVGAV